MGALIAFILPRWKWFVGGLAAALLVTMLLIARGDASHFKKLYEAQAQQTASANAKLAISNASIDKLQAALNDKNAESEQRAKAYADAKAADDADRAALAKQYASSQAARDALQAMAKVAGSNPACKVPMALSGALSGL